MASVFSDKLAKCIEAHDDIDRASAIAVDGGEEPYRTIMSIHPTNRTYSGEFPPWNPNANTPDSHTIEQFAGPDGDKWKTWLRDETSRLQRELLIAREKLPSTLEAPRLVTRLANLMDVFGARLTYLDYVGGAPRKDIGMISHRFGLRAIVAPEALPQVLEALGRMTRILEFADVEYQAGEDGSAGRLETRIDTYTYAGR